MSVFLLLTISIGARNAGAEEGTDSRRNWAHKAAFKGDGSGVSRDELVRLSQRLNGRLQSGRTTAKVVSRSPSSLSQLLAGARQPSVDPSNNFARDLRSTLRIAWHERNGTPVSIAFNARTGQSGKVLTGSGRLAKAPEQLALDFVEDQKALFRLETPADELRSISVLQDASGRHHVTLQQQHGGLPVWNHGMVIHLQADGAPYFVNARYGPTPKSLTNLVPQISRAEAIGRARVALEKSTPIQELSGRARQLLAYEGPSSTQCIWVDRASSSPHLAWHVEIRPNLKDNWHSFVDAHSGDILQQYNATATDGPSTAQARDVNDALRTVNGFETQGFFFMLDTSRPMFQATQSDILNDPRGVIWTLTADNTDLTARNPLFHVVSEDNVWDDPIAVSAHANAGLVFQYYLETHGRLGIDGTGGTIISVVHVTEDDESLPNAYWNGRFMAYGDGGQGLLPLAASLDVAAHELTHGVIQGTVNLEYAFESGALNESFADVFGAMVDRDDWLIGEDVVDAAVLGIEALRDMAEPNRLNQPAHMDQFVELTIDQDNGGVHVNSGIPNRACFLIAESIGRDKTEQIYYRIMDARYLNSQANFVDMRLAALRAAADLFGGSSAEIAAVAAAFDAVGIVGESGLEAPTDIVPMPGEEWILLVNAEAGDNSLYVARPQVVTKNDIIQLTPTQVYAVTSNSVTVSADGSFILFVDSANNLRIISADGSDEEILSDSGTWSSVAISPDGTKLAATTVRRDASILILDLVDAERSRVVELAGPTTQEGVEAKVTLFADAMDWDPNSEFLVYDAFNSVPTGDESLDYWDVNILVSDSESDVIIPLFPPQPAGFHLGNPSFANTNEAFVVFDFFDAALDLNQIWVYDIFSGEAGLIGTTGRDYSFPSFSPDDEQLVFEVFDEEREIVTIARVPLQPGRLEDAGPPEVFLLEAQSAKWFVITADDMTAVEETGGEGDAGSLPVQSELAQNYPNPFNAMTTLPYTLQRDGEMGLHIYDLAGQLMKVIDSGLQEAGSHAPLWDGTDGEGRSVASGVYFYTLRGEMGDVVLTKKMVLLR